MGYYNVVRPCVVGKLHYASIPAQPIEVDDEVAAPLVESGDLTRYGIFSAEDLNGVDLEGSLLGQAIADAGGPVYVAPQLGVGFVEPFEVPVEKPEPRPRGRRKAAED